MLPGIVFVKQQPPEWTTFIAHVYDLRRYVYGVRVGYQCIANTLLLYSSYGPTVGTRRRVTALTKQ